MALDWMLPWMPGWVPVRRNRRAHLGRVLYDVGKIGIRDAALLEPSARNPSGYEIMKPHTIIAERLGDDLKSLAALQPIVRRRRGRLDGSINPDRWHGDTVLPLAQIILELIDCGAVRPAYLG